MIQVHYTDTEGWKVEMNIPPELIGAVIGAAALIGFFALFVCSVRR